MIALITLKYTQSNSVCFAEGGQVIGVGAGSAVAYPLHEAGRRKGRQVAPAPARKSAQPAFRPEIKRPDRDNAIVYLSEDYEDVTGEGKWQQLFTEKPQLFPREAQRAYLASLSGVCLASDAFFPFGDNIERARKSGVTYVAQPGGSIRDDNVIDTCNSYGMVMAMTGMRLFHH